MIDDRPTASQRDDDQINCCRTAHTTASIVESTPSSTATARTHLAPHGAFGHIEPARNRLDSQALGEEAQDVELIRGQPIEPLRHHRRSRDGLFMP
ncbi:MAG TPA: hypothetical protein VE487_14135 [Ilumatobacter sp.]|nr:hypothetical protein [Ilumatobacter sp.]